MFTGGSPMRKALLDLNFDVSEDDLAPLFQYCEFCLKQVVADNEMGGLLEGLNGEFVTPGPGGDPIRNPLVLPTGKNMHALDPQAIPTTAACDCAKSFLSAPALKKNVIHKYLAALLVIVHPTLRLSNLSSSFPHAQLRR